MLKDIILINNNVNGYKGGIYELGSNLSSKGTTIIITTHTMDDAIHCDKLAYMKSGKILINQPPEKCLDTNKNIYSLEDAFIKLSIGKSNEVS